MDSDKKIRFVRRRIIASLVIPAVALLIYLNGSVHAEDNWKLIAVSAIWFAGYICEAAYIHYYK